MSSILVLVLATVAYCVAGVRYSRSLLAPRGAPILGRAPLTAAFVLHTAGLVVWGLELGRCPNRLAPETLAFMAWMMTALYLGLAPRWKLEILGVFAAPLASCLMLAALAASPFRTAGSGAHTRDPLLMAHIVTILLGYAAFLLASVLAALYLVQAAQLKQKTRRSFLERMPSLEVLDRSTYQLIGLGFPLLVLGLALGFARVSQKGGAFFTTDALLGVVTVVIYAVYVYARLVAGWQGRRVHQLLLVGLVFLTATYIGAAALPLLGTGSHAL